MAELNAEYVEKMEDVLEVYERPYQAAEPVVCLDEKPVSLHAHVRPPIPASCGKPGKIDNEYRRCGTANIFAVVEPKTGVHFTTVTPDRSAAEFAGVLAHIAERYPFARTIHLVMDNLSTHTRKALVDRFGEQEGGYLWNRFTIHYTPKHGSWLNQAEIELSLVARQCLGKRRLQDLTTLQEEVQVWNREANRQRVTIDWRFTRKDARKVFHYEAPRCRKRSSIAA